MTPTLDPAGTPTPTSTLTVSLTPTATQTSQTTPTFTPVVGIVTTVYWTDNQLSKIERSAGDGTGRQFLTPASSPRFIEVDSAAGMMYWTTGFGQIWRANLTGSAVQPIVFGQPCAMGIALDPTANKMYWTDCSADAIRRANLDGSGIQTIVTGLAGHPSGIAVDLTNGKLYWTITGGVAGSLPAVQRANLDGSNVQTVLTTGLVSTQDVAVDSFFGYLFITDGGRVLRSGLDGSGLITLVSEGNPVGVALPHPAEGKVYWTDNSLDRIRRSNTDGSGLQDLATTSLSSPWGIALVSVLGSPPPTATPTPPPSPTAGTKGSAQTYVPSTFTGDVGRETGLSDAATPNSISAWRGSSASTLYRVAL